MISVILPSVRPLKLSECINSVIAASEGVNFEIITITDFPELPVTNHHMIKHVVTSRRGVTHAINHGVAAAQGDYLFSLSDEATLGRNALSALESFCKMHDNNILATPKHIPYFPFYYYGKMFAPFPFAHRSLIDKVGWFIDPAFKAFYADPDLGMRTWSLGFEVKICEEAEIYHNNNMDCPSHKHNVNEYLLHDRELFRKRWDCLGEFRDP